MSDIKILNRRNHPYRHKIKVYGISIGIILVFFFILVVLFVIAVYSKQNKRAMQKQPGNNYHLKTN
jgi:hypothetical protein